MSYQLISITHQDRIAYITLNREEKRNALNELMVSELRQGFTELEKDDTIKVIILNAKGAAFSAGADLEYLQSLQDNSYEQNLEDSRQLKQLFYQIYTLDKVVIAQIEGHAIAGGCGLATVCDFSFAIPEAKFAYTETKIGFIPAIVMVFLLRKIGGGRAKSMLLKGDPVDAPMACDLGLINDVIPANLIHEQVLDFAIALCMNNSGISLKLCKKMIANIQELPLEEGLDYAAQMNAEARASSDCKKGIAAFLNKEKLIW